MAKGAPGLVQATIGAAIVYAAIVGCAIALLATERALLGSVLIVVASFGVVARQRWIRRRYFRS